LTAEVLSENTGRPLLKVNLGRVATHTKWEQSLEQIFSNAEAWKAILLIDEAEIVLEKRTFERMTQNSWISGKTRASNKVDPELMFESISS
jgi:SpoVK/Ycf46/Vps4 family AAA+-type ATPase